MRSNVPKDKIRFCFPPMSGPGAMHSKLQLLKYSNYLRIVVPSGNLMPYDWGESGTMENVRATFGWINQNWNSDMIKQTVFVIDLPKIEDPERRSANKLNAFGNDLCYFLSAQGLDERLIQSLTKLSDFSETDRYAFVHSMYVVPVSSKPPSHRLNLGNSTVLGPMLAMMLGEEQVCRCRGSCPAGKDRVDTVPARLLWARSCRPFALV